MKIPVLITSAIFKKEYEDATRECMASITSKDHLLEVMVDPLLYPNKLSEKWNKFLDFYRGGFYKYLIILANDTLGSEQSIDNFVRFMEENPEVGIGEATMERSLDVFRDVQESKSMGFSKNYQSQPIDTCNFIIRRGVIEKVGKFNEVRYPFAMGERDYLWRCKQAGVVVAYTEMKLFYHPPESMTKENRGDFTEDQKRYIEQWGGIDLNEVYTTPFNNTVFDYSFSEY